MTAIRHAHRIIENINYNILNITTTYFHSHLKFNKRRNKSESHQSSVDKINFSLRWCVYNTTRIQKIMKNLQSCSLRLDMLLLLKNDITSIYHLSRLNGLWEKHETEKVKKEELKRFEKIIAVWTRRRELAAELKIVNEKQQQRRLSRSSEHRQVTWVKKFQEKITFVLSEPLTYLTFVAFNIHQLRVDLSNVHQVKLWFEQFFFVEKQY